MRTTEQTVVSTYSWCFAIPHSPDACAHFFQTYPLVSIPLYLLLLSTCIYVFILLDSFTLQQQCKVLFPPFPNLFLLTQHLSTFVTYISHFTATLMSSNYTPACHSILAVQEYAKCFLQFSQRDVKMSSTKTSTDVGMV